MFCWVSVCLYVFVFVEQKLCHDLHQYQKWIFCINYFTAQIVTKEDTNWHREIKQTDTYRKHYLSTYAGKTGNYWSFSIEIVFQIAEMGGRPYVGHSLGQSNISRGYVWPFTTETQDVY